MILEIKEEGTICESVKGCVVVMKKDAFDKGTVIWSKNCLSFMEAEEMAGELETLLGNWGCEIEVVHKVS